MSVLSNRTSHYTLSSKYPSITNLYEAIETALANLRYTKTSFNGDHLFGVSPNGTLVDIIFLLINGTSFWRVLIAAGDLQIGNDDDLSNLEVAIANLG